MNKEDRLDASAIHLQAPRPSMLRNYLELMRLPNVFTAMADVAMGFFFVQAAGPQWMPTHKDLFTLASLIAASSFLYLAGMVLNDVFDLETDRRERPERPLPSGRVSLVAAWWLGWKLLAAGVLLGAVAAFLAGHIRPAVVAILLAVLIVLYDIRLKNTPLGPVAMGGCRMLNVLLGMSALAGAVAAEHWLVAGGLGLYVAGVTWFARREAEQSNRLQLAAATLTISLSLALLAWLPDWSDRLILPLQQEPHRWRLLIAMLGLLIVWRCVWAVIEPVPLRVRMAVAQCVLSLVMLDAALCYSTCGLLWAAMILLLLVPALFLGRWIAVT